MELTIILCIVLIHELGHYLMARLFNWRINHITLWIFGGVMETEEHGTKSILENTLVTIAGPFQHIFIYIISYLLLRLELLPLPIFELIFFYNTVILLFNSLPIWPLDGGKLLLSFLSYLLPYRMAYQFAILFSLLLSISLMIIKLLFFSFNLGTFFILVFLMMENRLEWKRRFYVFIRFLLKRYEGKSVITKVSSITIPENTLLKEVFYRFKQDEKHIIYITSKNNKRLTLDENDCLHYYFSNRMYDKTIGEIAREINA